MPLPYNAMKTRHAAVLPIETMKELARLRLKTATAGRRAGKMHDQASEAKSALKKARKAFKQAKRATKEARKEFKVLKKALSAAMRTFGVKTKPKPKTKAASQASAPKATGANQSKPRAPSEASSSP